MLMSDQVRGKWWVTWVTGPATKVDIVDTVGMPNGNVLAIVDANGDIYNWANILRLTKKEP